MKVICYIERIFKTATSDDQFVEVVVPPAAGSKFSFPTRVVVPISSVEPQEESGR